MWRVILRVLAHAAFFVAVVGDDEAAHALASKLGNEALIARTLSRIRRVRPRAKCVSSPSSTRAICCAPTGRSTNWIEGETEAEVLRAGALGASRRTNSRALRLCQGHAHSRLSHPDRCREQARTICHRRPEREKIFPATRGQRWSPRTGRSFRRSLGIPSRPKQRSRRPRRT